MDGGFFGQYAVIDNSSFLDNIGASNISIQVWFSLDANFDTFPTLFSNRDSTNIEGIVIGFESMSTEMYPRVVYNNGITLSNYTVAQPDSIWHQFIFTVQDTISVYIDSTLILQNTSTVYNSYSIANGLAPIYLGYDIADSSKSQYIGHFGEIAIWNRALDQSEINTLYTTYISQDCDVLIFDDDILAYYPINDALSSSQSVAHLIKNNQQHDGHLGDTTGTDACDPVQSSNDPFTITNVLTFSNCTSSPTKIPTANPTINPSVNPTRAPTSIPTDMPSKIPSNDPSMMPSSFPTGTPPTATGTGLIDTTQGYAYEYEFITNDDISLWYFEALSSVGIDSDMFNCGF